MGEIFLCEALFVRQVIGIAYEPIIKSNHYIEPSLKECHFIRVWKHLAIGNVWGKKLFSSLNENCRLNLRYPMCNMTWRRKQSSLTVNEIRMSKGTNCNNRRFVFVRQVQKAVDEKLFTHNYVELMSGAFDEISNVFACIEVCVPCFGKVIHIIDPTKNASSTLTNNYLLRHCVSERKLF